MESMTANRVRGTSAAQPAEARSVTLLELVWSLSDSSDSSDDDQRVVGAVCGLLEGGEVRLCGNFRGQILRPT